MNEDNTAHQSARPPSGLRPPRGTPRAGRIMWGRIISLAGAIGLCVSFFIPQIPHWVAQGGAKGHMVATAPVHLVVRDVLFLVVYGLPFLAAVLLLPLLAVRVMTRENTGKGIGACLAWTECLICLAVLIAGLGRVAYLFIAVFFQGAVCVTPIGYALSVAGVVTLALAVVSLVQESLPRKVAGAQFALWTYCLVYFAYIAITWAFVAIAPGMWLSISACGLLTLGSAIDWFQCRPARPAANNMGAGQ